MRPRHALLLTLPLFACTLPAVSQVSEAAVGDRPHAWGGVGISDFNPDYGASRLYGLYLYGDYTVRRYLGFEGEIRLEDLNKPLNLSEKAFLAGPLVTFFRYRRFDVYGKFEVGAATVTYPETAYYTSAYGSYFAYAPGFGVEYRLRPRIKIRGDYEHEFLPAAPDLPDQPNNGLTPRGYSAGISYRFH